MSWRNDIKVVVAIEFGTKYSHKLNPEIITNYNWPEQLGALRTNTALKYDEKYENVLEWGYPALGKKFQRKGRYGRNKNFSNEPVELFKLHLSAMPDSEKPPLPKLLNYKKAITDFLREIVPEEYPIKSLGILRECTYNAALISYLTSEKLQFITELEAAAIHCMQVSREHFGTSKGSEVTEQTGDLCGSNYVDKEFIKLLKRVAGDEAIKIFEQQHYGQMQYLMQEFSKRLKFYFSGFKKDFNLYELDLEDVCPAIKQCDFSESRYLQMRVREEFVDKVKSIAVPKQPQAAIVRGALEYGLQKLEG
ncbi:10325_t:CDS:2 [Diversispora eburnea]|uniref:10325_t:CDS:1 n=1 Tax=Diversispora eburnea TaxID=1213867 RepID=A0A9N9BWR6_9GLOM|nr:10325_t:CDS:2 [Diversispora eburnea]